MWCLFNILWSDDGDDGSKCIAQDTYCAASKSVIWASVSLYLTVEFAYKKQQQCLQPLWDVSPLSGTSTAYCWQVQFFTPRDQWHIIWTLVTLYLFLFVRDFSKQLCNLQSLNTTSQNMTSLQQLGISSLTLHSCAYFGRLTDDPVISSRSVYIQLQLA